MANATTAAAATTTAPVGRPVSPVTLAIRKLVKQKKGNITFSVAKPLLEAAGVDVSGETFESKFNMAKYNFIKHQAEKGTDWAVEYTKTTATTEPVPAKRKVGRPAKVGTALPPPKHKGAVAPVVTSNDNFALATKFVESAGGLSKAKVALDARKAELDRDTALLAAFEAGVAALSKLAS